MDRVQRRSWLDEAEVVLTPREFDLLWYFVQHPGRVFTRTELLALLERDSRYRQRWIEIDRVGYRPNRMVAYPSGVLHSATRHHGASLRRGRLYQTFRIGVDWSTFRAAKP